MRSKSYDISIMLRFDIIEITVYTRAKEIRTNTHSHGHYNRVYYDPTIGSAGGEITVLV